jgi:hypothetical protein
MKKFIYTGKQPHNSTIRVDQDGKKVPVDLRLAPGDEVDLQEDHSIVKAMIDTGLLVESKQNSIPQKSTK